MNKTYGGLVSNPVNKIDVTIPNNRTITFGGSVVETTTIVPDKIVLATISLLKDPASTGTVTGGGIYQVGTSITVVATPDTQSDYPEFDGWYEGETKVSENASYTFTVSGARTLVAKFKEAAIPSVEIYADLNCTVRPSLGVEYASLYVKFNRKFEFNDNKIWESMLAVETPTTENPEGTYFIAYCADWTFDVPEIDSPIRAGDIFKLINMYPDMLPDNAVFDFYD